MKLLTTLYKIYSPTGNERVMSEFVQSQLDEMGVKYELDKHQIHSLKPNTPLISCHMDQVGWTRTTELTILEDVIWGDSQIGADDKNGIWICLNLLKHFGGENLSFIFSTGEEAGCDIDDVLEEYDEKILDGIKYGLVFDRRGSGDIIGSQNDYCRSDLEYDLWREGEAFGYSPCMGVWSDADIISYYDIPCVNLSVGYYRAHTDWEFTNLKELANSLAFGKHIIENVDSTYERADYYKRNRHTARYMRAGNDVYGVGYGSYSGWDNNGTYLEEEEQEDFSKWPFYCPGCDEALDEFDLTDDYLCRDCFGEVIAMDDYDYYEFEHKKYENDSHLHDLLEDGDYHDHTDPHHHDLLEDGAADPLEDSFGIYHETTDGWIELFYCPVCCDFVEEDKDNRCPKCKAQVINSSMYANKDW